MLEEFNDSGPVPERAVPTHAARGRFPCGLFQPAGSFRFSSNALLLACFPSLEDVRTAMDLGAGCGVIGLALLCRKPDLRVTGIDRTKSLVAAAVANARQLGFASRYAALTADLVAAASSGGPDSAPVPGVEPGAFDLVTANPPYRQRHRGRLPARLARLDALFETASTQQAFCLAASRALKPGGRFCLIYPASREAEMAATLARHDLRLTRLLPLVAKHPLPPELLLMESVKQPHAKKAGVHPPVQEAPLILHEPSGAFTGQALALCPYLAKNAGSTGTASPAG